jgi:hypothetical protein
MITSLLAASDCRNGNCPTVWATDRDTVLVQGYVERSRRAHAITVRVPGPILDGAAASMLCGTPPTIPSQAGPLSEWAIEPDGNDFLVTGPGDTPDAEACNAPDGEAVVELPAVALTRLPATREEAVA